MISVYLLLDLERKIVLADSNNTISVILQPNKTLTS